MSLPLDRPPAAQAGPEPLALQKWEAFVGWFLNHTGRWPKAARFTLTQRLENHALDVTKLLVQARYEPTLRARLLHDVNLRLERMRFLCRVAREGWRAMLQYVPTAPRTVPAECAGSLRRRPRR